MLNIIPFIQPQPANFLVTIIMWLVGITSSVAGGIILFTLLLKLITTPFDVMSKISTRKNAIKMEKMRPELEKLQKQYADDKKLYQQKMMALYKKNGYSMFGACLPTIITLVIFIVAITGFNNYSSYQNLTYFYNMSNSYNQVIYDGIDEDFGENKYIIKDEKGVITIKVEDFVNAVSEGQTYGTLTISDKDGNPITVNITKGITELKEGEVVKDTLPYVIYNTGSYVESQVYYSIDDAGAYKVDTTYYYSTDELLFASDMTNKDGKKFSDLYSPAGTIEEGKTAIVANENKALEGRPEASAFIEKFCQVASADTYRKENSSFLWVKNIWIADSPLAHPINDYNGFKGSYGEKFINESNYNSLIAELETEKNSVNGYFILAIITIGISILSQWIVGRTQKAQMELQTVNGQGAQTQKVMMWIMPIMMGIFAFMYTSALSIYMILSSGISILSTLGINWIVDKKYGKIKKKDGEKEVVRGRVRDEEPEPVKEKKKSRKERKAEEQQQGDFITGAKGEEPKKHFRGRLK